MLTEAEVVPRLVLAVGVGAAIGIERQIRHKVAGLRTHALVALACAMTMSVSLLLHNQVPLATGILTGVGFIGAGAVIRTEATVTGLTTAGTIWMTAALGVAIGAGFYVLAVTAVVLTFLTLDVLGRFEHRLVHEETQQQLDRQALALQQQAQVIDALTRQPAPPPTPVSPLSRMSMPAHSRWWHRWRP